MTGNAEDSNQANGPLAFLGSFWAELSNQEKVILGVPIFLFITTLWKFDTISEDLQPIAFLGTTAVFVLAWAVVLILQWRKSRNRTTTLARERDLIVENWNTRYEQMHELRKKATKIQRNLESLVQEGRLESDNESLSDIDQLVIEIDKYIDTTSRRVLELEQSQGVVKTPDENQAIVDMLKRRKTTEAVQESRSNRSTSR